MIRKGKQAELSTKKDGGNERRKLAYYYYFARSFMKMYMCILYTFHLCIPIHQNNLKSFFWLISWYTQDKMYDDDSNKA